MDTLLQDLRFAVRMLRKSPALLIVAVLTLAVGIGSNAAIFSAVKTVLLRPLGMREPDRVVMLWPRNVSRNIPMGLASPARFADWKRENHVFSEMACATDSLYTMSGSGDPQDFVAWQISANFMHVLGAQPFLGHDFTSENEQKGNHRFVLLSYRIWRTKFGGDESIVGRSVTLNDQPFIIAGVMPHDFSFPSDVTDVWTPLVLSPSDVASRKATMLRTIARLRPGVTHAQAVADMAQLSARLGQQYPDSDGGWDVSIESARHHLSGDVRGPLLALAAAVGFVLLIACVNTANLLLARSVLRRREMGVRVALGASRARVVRLVLTESILLGLVSCGAGLLIARWEAAVLVRMFPKNITNLSIPSVQQIPIDWPVILFCIGLAFLTSLLFGTAPALHASGIAPVAVLKAETGSIAGGGSSRARAALVIAQLSIALVLLVCAGLMIKSFTRLQNTPLGFNADRVLTAQMFLSRNRYKTDPERSRFVQEVTDHIAVMPGVEAVGAVNFLPLSGFWGTLSFTVADMSPAPVSQWPEADYRIASEDYFRTMQIPILRGRGFTSQDTAQSQLVCVINQTLARKFFPDQDPVGKFLTANPEIFGKKPFLIVGVVGDVKHFGAGEEGHAEVYRPFSQDGFPLIALAVRTRSDPAILADPVRRAIWSVDKSQSIFRVMTLDEAAADTIIIRRISAMIFVFFAGVALFLSVIGIYGVVSYLIAQRTREIGIRIALGAPAARVMRMVLGYSLRVAMIGLAIGVPVAFGVSRLLRALLFHVGTTDPLVFITVPVLLCAVAVIAAWVPATRASRVQPMDALRNE
jgi:predicted permease